MIYGENEIVDRGMGHGLGQSIIRVMDRCSTDDLGQGNGHLIVKRVERCSLSPHSKVETNESLRAGTELSGQQNIWMKVKLKLN